MVRAVELLKAADVIVYDDLGAQGAVACYAAPAAETIYVGKRGQRESIKQGSIDEILVQQAAQGKRVVRLKGGCPSVFARLHSELEALTRAGIPVEVVPGVSSALAAPLAAGFPLTHPELSRGFVVASAHDPDILDWRCLAVVDTLVLLMAGSTLAAVMQRLRENGKPESTPMQQLSRGAARPLAARAVARTRAPQACLGSSAARSAGGSAGLAGAALLSPLRLRATCSMDLQGALLARQLQRSLTVSAVLQQAPQAERSIYLNPSIPDTEFVVINAFHLVEIAEPGRLVGEFRAALEGKDVKGRIYLSEQGLNSQFGGRREDAMAFAEWVAAHPLFQGIRFNGPDAVDGHMYPRLRLQYKPNLISMAGGMKGVPVTEPTARAEPVPPAEWKRMLQEAQELPPEKRPVVLDLRNSYEWDAGHFIGAERPLEDNFHETPTETTDEKVPNYVRDVDPDRPVMMYCTGGIRCDVYSAYLKQKGYSKLYTLDKGIQNYFAKEGADCWNGSLYVFDARMAVRPEEPADTPADQLPAAVPCQMCGEAAVLPHMNCANVDCNKLFLACNACKTQYNGCCCPDCVDAPRLLRPPKVAGQYGNFSQYAEDGSLLRGPSRISKRRKRLQLLREREKAERSEKMERRRVAKAAMAQRAEQHDGPAKPAGEDAEREERMEKLRELRQRLMEKTGSRQTVAYEAV
ncbi:hypothetical protein N2152v2_007931 [Parachlorella kessleri]